MGDFLGGFGILGKIPQEIAGINTAHGLPVLQYSIPVAYVRFHGRGKFSLASSDYSTGQTILLL